MATSIYVGNLPWSATQEGVESLFSPYGEVLSVKLVSDRETGRARGFGFVEMEDADAINAIAALDGKEFEGRALRAGGAGRGRHGKLHSGGGRSRAAGGVRQISPAGERGQRR